MGASSFFPVVKMDWLKLLTLDASTSPYRWLCPPEMKHGLLDNPYLADDFLIYNCLQTL
jgi:hypothetical protein